MNAPSPLHRAAPRGGPVVSALVLISMFAWVLAFTPTPFAWATIPGFVGMLALLERSRSTKRAILGLCLFGAITIGFGYRWLAPTVMDFGKQSAPVAWLLTALFGVIGTVHGWIFAVLYRAMQRPTRRAHPLAVALVWVACEALPIRLFAWMAGHGAIDVPALAQHAEWGGVPAVSLVLLCLVTPLYELGYAVVRRAESAPPRLGAAIITVLIGAAGFGWGLWRVDQVRRADEAAPKALRVGIVQSNIGSEAKRTAEQRQRGAVDRSILAYTRGSKAAVDAGAQLVVWPETAITDPVPMQSGALTVDRYLRTRRYRAFTEHGERTAFLVGAYEAYPTKRGEAWTRRGRGVDRYNTAALRTPGASGKAMWSTVRKVYLIPFGEAMPFGIAEEEFLPQNFKMRAGEAGQKPLALADLTLVPFLCYEGILAGHVREACAEQQPDVLVSLTNDSWFGDTWEPYQHLNFTRFRAIEHRAPLVRATNTGISAFVNAAGDVVASLPLFKEDVLVRDVPLRERGRTVFAQWGHHLPKALWVLALLLVLVYVMRAPAYVESEER